MKKQQKKDESVATETKIVQIANIDIDKIEPHHDNPRKDIGDLTELAESIKKSGILQNLTVVPWFSTITRAPADDGKMDGHYIAVIGHRRLAAAKLAGLTTVPCIITDMDQRTQIATMLSENMQRSDLTIYEQAQGFQIMLNLGENISSIAEKTGFSESTVRKRTKLLEMDNEKVKEAVGKGATLMDFMKLDEIKDLEQKNKALEKFGSSDFNYFIMTAVETEKKEANREKIIEKLNTFAIKIDNDAGFNTVRWINFYNPEKFNVPDDVLEKKYYYLVSKYNIQLLMESETNEEDDKSKKIREVKVQLEAMSKMAYDLRFEFIKTYPASKAKQNIKIIIEIITRTLIEGGYAFLDLDDFIELLDIDFDDDGNEEFTFETIDIFDKAPALVLLLDAYCFNFDNPNFSYVNFNCEYKTNERLDLIYELLGKLGYEISSEEKKLADGTHELYMQPENTQE